ncbi:MAG: hypothetical protein WA633_27030 [Stellaceae bacterium]
MLRLGKGWLGGRWENALDMARLQRHLTRAGDIETDAPEKALA